MPDIDVDLGAMPLEHALTLRRCIARTLECGMAWSHTEYQQCVSLQAMLDFKIGMAKKDAVQPFVPTPIRPTTGLDES